ncbi:MAG: aminotransferase class V-fold PLP-dependent enzyme, partial [Erysipelotrichaceae bacterium]|nr:aminotransferase class V-fold PLP-dependent enzyme [Erysipelotrichaceae bacterium]
SDILPWFKTCEMTGAKIEYVPLTEDGHLTVENFEKAMHEGVKVVALTFVSNVLGYELPVKEICRIAHSYGAIVAIDGAQAVPHAIVDVQDLDCDFLAFSSHKMCGPSGAGVLYGKYELLDKMDAFLFGGGANARFDKEGNIILKEAPYKFEAGTPNIEGTLGMKAAAEYLMNIGMENIVAYDRELQKYFCEKMLELDNIEYYNPKADVGLVTFNVKGIFAQDAASYLAANHIDVRSGNHCAKILWNTIGATETLRASLYLYNTKAEIDRFIEVLRDITLEKCVGVLL